MPYLIEAITPSDALGGKLQTQCWFDATHAHDGSSPIDEFIQNMQEINKLYLSSKANGTYTPTLGSLAYLGLVSAAESYIRSLLRRLILLDEVCQRLAETRDIPYGAAVHHEPELLPEAIIERVSFASARNVTAELKNLCGITRLANDGVALSGLEDIFQAFDEICQIRHCGVHRFGKLGPKQAMTLGISTHKALLGKPLKLEAPDVEAVATVLLAFVTGINSFCFRDIIQRTHTHSQRGSEASPKMYYNAAWSGNYAEDRPRFEAYYDIFSSKRPPQASPGVEALYADFVKFMSDQNEEIAKKLGTNNPAMQKKKALALPAPAAPP